MISKQWQEAIDMIEDSVSFLTLLLQIEADPSPSAFGVEQKITKTDAIKQYKISEKHLAGLSHITKRNPHDRHGNTVMRLYIEAAVEAKALKLHGGPVGHEEQ
jgi:hypothetical protein